MEQREITEEDLTTQTTQPPYLPLEELQKVDEKAKKVTGYAILGVQLTEYDSELTKDDIFEIFKEHPETKLW